MSEKISLDSSDYIELLNQIYSLPLHIVQFND